MEIVVFTLNAIFIYFLADWILKALQSRRDEPLKHPQVVFFAIFLVLALVSFRLLRTLFENFA